MNLYLELAIAITASLGHGLRVLLSWILYPLTPLWYFLYILILPVIHLGQAAWSLISYPARMFPGSLVEVIINLLEYTRPILTRSQTMYIFLSSAVLIGFFTGGLLLCLQMLFTEILKLNQPSEPAPQPAKRSMTDHRDQRQKRREQIKNTPLTDVDELGYVSPKSVFSSGHISPLASPAMTNSQMKWAPRSLIASPSIIHEEASSDDSF